MHQDDPNSAKHNAYIAICYTGTFSYVITSLYLAPFVILGWLTIEILKFWFGLVGHYFVAIKPLIFFLDVILLFLRMFWAFGNAIFGRSPKRNVFHLIPQFSEMLHPSRLTFSWGIFTIFVLLIIMIASIFSAFSG
ncbi:hypothetical protein Pse7367_3752 (plasmid) [Thalassoporum mexicanum PCC 7367]|uniref:hypothetical protein n=1 Tax=Thalassoporum mexicanum TaxID=3457544 RepID=UPI00029FA34D|nr:hypothetical protein [Pseudanabaena sp. PCC 7367]AFY71978.1 hypothetical protein Pse7367_3752 [Pseudanabaena sp. PCC 7367]